MRVLILGAGFGGLELATTLDAALGSDVEVVLVDRADGFVFGFSKLDVMFGRATADHVLHRYADLAPPGVRFVQATVRADRPGRPPGRDRRGTAGRRRPGRRARRRPAPRGDARAGRARPRVLHGRRRVRAARRARDVPRRQRRRRGDLDAVQVPARAERDRADGARPAARARPAGRLDGVAGDAARRADPAVPDRVRRRCSPRSPSAASPGTPGAGPRRSTGSPVARSPTGPSSPTTCSSACPCTARLRSWSRPG